MRPPEPTPPPEDELAHAWKALLARKSQLGTDRRLAELALELISALGNTSDHRETLVSLAEAWTEDWRLILATASLLIAQAERRGMDEPVVSESTPAHTAAAALSRCLEALTPDEAQNPDIAGNLHASLGNALRRCGPSEDDRALEAFQQALGLDESRGSWWYDLGLLHKWRGRFEDGYGANTAALRHGAPPRPARWNLAICATARGEGNAAMEAWKALGMPAETDPTTGMPFVDGLPPMLVRVLSRPSAVDGTSVLPEGVGFEMVWVAPLSPCHGVVQSPTFRDAPIDYGDLVLWDGAPIAEHVSGPQDRVPVFALLEILKRGAEKRWPFVALEREAGALESLRAALPNGARLFVQHEQLEQHCAACEAGTPHEHSASPSPVPAPASEDPSLISTFRRGVIVVPPEVDLVAFRASWEQGLGARRLVAALPSLYEALQETKLAGQEHQAWRGIEKNALRQRANA
ncbi:MAG: hypothetical protein WBG86_02030 [Polyangiales bacterium]